jgi:hypothetical protein
MKVYIGTEDAESLIVSTDFYTKLWFVHQTCATFLDSYPHMTHHMNHRITPLTDYKLCGNIKLQHHKQHGHPYIVSMAQWP